MMHADVEKVEHVARLSQSGGPQVLHKPTR